MPRVDMILNELIEKTDEVKRELMFKIVTQKLEHLE